MPDVVLALGSAGKYCAAHLVNVLNVVFPAHEKVVSGHGSLWKDLAVGEERLQHELSGRGLHIVKVDDFNGDLSARLSVQPARIVTLKTCL